jgi:hypothetical protein
VEGETTGVMDEDGLTSGLSKVEGGGRICIAGRREERFVSTGGGTVVSESPGEKGREWSRSVKRVSGRRLDSGRGEGLSTCGREPGEF